MKTIDLNSWPRIAQYRFFRNFDRPHYATTARMDVSAMMARKGKVSPYRGCLYAIGAGVHGVPALLMRMRDDLVIQHDAVGLSTTVPSVSGSFNYANIPYVPDFDSFANTASALIARAAAETRVTAYDDPDDALIFMSCLPWLDYTSINNAIRDADDCIPRVSWGKIVREGERWKMSMTIEVHHALVDGADVGAYFDGVQTVFDRF